MLLIILHHLGLHGFAIIPVLLGLVVMSPILATLHLNLNAAFYRRHAYFHRSALCRVAGNDFWPVRYPSGCMLPRVSSALAIWLILG